MITKVNSVVLIRFVTAVVITTGAFTILSSAGHLDITGVRLIGAGAFRGDILTIMDTIRIIIITVLTITLAGIILIITMVLTGTDTIMVTMIITITQPTGMFTTDTGMHVRRIPTIHPEEVHR